jgi:hypothetical protein
MLPASHARSARFTARVLAVCAASLVEACGHASRNRNTAGPAAPDAQSGAGSAEDGGDADDGDGGPSDDGGVVVLDASCRVEIDHPPVLPGTHVPVGSTIQWNSNPPSSGPHFPIWAAYQSYTAPVPRGYYVHDLEHGAVVLLSNCGDGHAPT